MLAAGNDHGHRCEAPEPNCVQGEIDASSPGLFAGLPAREASLRGHVVAGGGRRTARGASRCFPTAAGLPRNGASPRRATWCRWPRPSRTRIRAERRAAIRRSVRDLPRRAVRDRGSGGAEALVPEPDDERGAAGAAATRRRGLRRTRLRRGARAPRISIWTATGAPASSRRCSVAGSWTWARRPRRWARFP